MTIISETRSKLIAALKEHAVLSAKEAGAVIGMERRATHEALRRMVEKDMVDVDSDGKVHQYSLKGKMPLPEAEAYRVHNKRDPYALPPAFFTRAAPLHVTGE